MKIIVHVILVTFLFFSGMQAIGQPPFIDSVRIFPSSPTKNDTVRIALHVSTPSPSKTLNLSQSITTGNILITACYNSDNTAAQMDTLSDTLIIGKLPEGLYKLKIKTYYNEFFSNPYCDNIADSSSLIDSFTVYAPESITQDMRANISIFPNPASEHIFISLPVGLRMERIVLQDMSGRILKVGNENKLNIAELAPGVYILQVQTGNDRFVHKLRKI